LLVELVLVFLVFGYLREHLHALLYQVLLDHLQDFVLLQVFSGDVERQVLGVDDTFDEVQPLGNQFVAVVHDEHSAHLQLDVAFLLLGLEQVKRCSLGHEQQRLELQLTLHREVLDGQVVLPVVRQRLLEGALLFLGHLRRLAHPDWLLLVQVLLFVGHFLDFLFLLLLRFLLFVGDVFYFVFFFGIFFLVFIFFLFFIVRFCDFFFFGLFHL